MGFKPQVKEILKLNRRHSEGRITLAEFIGSANRLIEGAFLDGEISLLQGILKAEGGKHEDRDPRI